MFSLRWLLKLVCLALCIASVSASAQGSLRVAAAADLTFAIRELGDAYKARTGVSVEPTFGSSGTLSAQIANGAPFDLFFSADLEYPRKLIDAKHAESGTMRTYAVGTLVLWTRRDSGLDLKQGIGVLESGGVQKIAIANPQTAPYGRAAAAALRYYKLDEKLQAKLVTGENVAQTAQFVQSGNAQVGFIGEALALAPTLRAQGEFWIVPQESYPPLAQGAVVLTRSQRKDAARAFLDFVVSAEGQKILSKYGFEPASSVQSQGSKH